MNNLIKNKIIRIKRILPYLKNFSNKNKIKIIVLILLNTDKLIN
jgi:hypothetical protein